MKGPISKLVPLAVLLALATAALASAATRSETPIPLGLMDVKSAARETGTSTVAPLELVQMSNSGIRHGIRASNQVPFRVRYSLLDASLAPTATPGVFAVNERGVGQGTELGNLTWTSQETASFVDIPGKIKITNGRYVFTAADGSQLFASYEAEGAFVDALGNAHFDGSFVITGGTQRFSDASGDGTIRFDVNILTLKGSGFVAGTISRQ